MIRNQLPGDALKTLGGLGMKTDYSRVEADKVFFAIWHDQWDANIHHHADQGVIIQVKIGNQNNGINLLRFNCFFYSQYRSIIPTGALKSVNLTLWRMGIL